MTIFLSYFVVLHIFNDIYIYYHFCIKYSEDFVNKSLVFLIKYLCSYSNLYSLCTVFLGFCKNYLVLRKYVHKIFFSILVLQVICNFLLFIQKHISIIINFDIFCVKYIKDFVNKFYSIERKLRHKLYLHLNGFDSDVPYIYMLKDKKRHCP